MSHSLFNAAQSGDLAALEAQLAAGAAVDWRHQGIGRTALIEATIGRHLDAVTALLRQGASVDTRCAALGWASLAWAAYHGDDGIARTLIAYGASLDLASPDLKRTALMTAAQLGHARTVALLLDAGADPGQLDFRQENAWSLARGNGHEAILPLLETAGSGPPPPKPVVESLPWPEIGDGVERSTPETVVRTYILAMAAWEAKGHARRLEAAGDPAFWAEQRDIVARCCTAKKRAYPFASYGSPSKHAAEDRLLCVTQSSAAKTEMIVLHFNGVEDYEHCFSVHRKGGEWRIDNLRSRLQGTDKWERDIL